MPDFWLPRAMRYVMKPHEDHAFEGNVKGVLLSAELVGGHRSVSQVVYLEMYTDELGHIVRKLLPCNWAIYLLVVLCRYLPSCSAHERSTEKRKISRTCLALASHVICPRN